jgi:hypothetical protein
MTSHSPEQRRKKNYISLVWNLLPKYILTKYKLQSHYKYAIQGHQRQSAHVKQVDQTDIHFSHPSTMQCLCPQMHH